MFRSLVTETVLLVAADYNDCRIVLTVLPQPDDKSVWAVDQERLIRYVFCL